MAEEHHMVLGKMETFYGLPPFFFFTRMTGEAQGLQLSSITLSASRAATCLSISSHLSGEVRKARCRMGLWWPVLIWCFGAPNHAFCC